MKKFLDIMIIVLLTVLIVSLFGSKNDKKDLENTLNISFEKKNYKIPASVKVLVQNYTSSGVNLNTCKDIHILRNGDEMVFSQDFCKDISVASKEVYTIDYSSEYKKFDKTGEYNLASAIGDKKFIDQTKIENKGTIAKIFTFFIFAPIYNLMIALIILFNGSFGWAIVGITLILKLVLFWPQQKMMVSQRRLQEIQPKIKEIQEKYKGKQQEIGMKLMELYKKENVNPMGSCGFLLIQMPILIVVYNVILGIQEPSSVYYLYSFFNTFSLTSIDFTFYGLDLLSHKGVQGVILALLVGIVQFIQIKISLPVKKEESKTGIVLEKKEDEKSYSNMMPDQDVMNKFMLYGLPIMVTMFTFNLLTGVGLSWGISTLLTLFQNIFVNKMLKNKVNK